VQKIIMNKDYTFLKKMQTSLYAYDHLLINSLRLLIYQG